MPLTMIKSGMRVKLVSINGGRRLRSRLADLGMILGVEIEIINNTLGGPFLVGIKGSRIAIGKGMAMKIEVQ